jgi:hypothetical protein
LDGTDGRGFDGDTAAGEFDDVEVWDAFVGFVGGGGVEVEVGEGGVSEDVGFGGGDEDGLGSSRAAGFAVGVVGG